MPRNENAPRLITNPDALSLSVCFARYYKSFLDARTSDAPPRGQTNAGLISDSTHATQHSWLHSILLRARLFLALPSRSIHIVSTHLFSHRLYVFAGDHLSSQSEILDNATKENKRKLVCDQAK